MNQDDNTSSGVDPLGSSAVPGVLGDDSLVNPTTPAEEVAQPVTPVADEPQYASSVDAHMANQANMGVTPVQSVPVEPAPPPSMPTELGAEPVEPVVSEPPAVPTVGFGAGASMPSASPTVNTPVGQPTAMPGVKKPVV